MALGVAVAVELWYEGREISQFVDIEEAVWRDRSREKADTMELTLSGAEKWGTWGVSPDDKLELKGDGWRTGTMFVSAAFPENGTYRIFASAVPAKGRVRKWASFRGRTLEGIGSLVAGEIGMGFRLWGLPVGIVYPYVVRENETAPAFLERLAQREGAVLKCWAGQMAMIGIEKAQERSPGETIRTDWVTPGMDYRRRWDLGTGALTLHSPYASATARDPGEAGERTEESEARTGAEAKRWARGKLLTENRLRETLEITGDFTPRWTAMGRIDTEGPVALGGNWTIDEVEHDLVKEKSRCVLLRNTEGIE